MNLIFTVQLLLPEWVENSTSVNCSTVNFFICNRVFLNYTNEYLIVLSSNRLYYCCYCFAVDDWATGFQDYLFHYCCVCRLSDVPMMTIPYRRTTTKDQPINKISHKLHQYVPQSIFLLLIQFVLLLLFCSLSNGFSGFSLWLISLFSLKSSTLLGGF